MDNKLFELYTLAELTYEKRLKNLVNRKYKLYPIGWYENKNYKEKIEILKSKFTKQSEANNKRKNINK